MSSYSQQMSPRQLGGQAGTSFFFSLFAPAPPPLSPRCQSQHNIRTKAISSGGVLIAHHHYALPLPPRGREAFPSKACLALAEARAR